MLPDLIGAYQEARRASILESAVKAVSILGQRVHQPRPSQDPGEIISLRSGSARQGSLMITRSTVRDESMAEESMSEAGVALADLLRLAEWGPRQLVTAINSRLSGRGRDRLRLDPTAGYSWVNRGFRPRSPIPDVAAAVLSERLGYTVTAGQLWPGRLESGELRRSAADELDGVADIDDLVRELGQLGMTATTPQSPIDGAAGIELTAAVDQLRGAVVVARDRAGHDYVLPEQVDLISLHVAALRRLDDRHGGGALSLRYVTAELRSVVDLVEYASYGPVTGRQLLTIVADLGSGPARETARPGGDCGGG
jgi:hypothetical protein